jgi:hypothetical protein
MIGVVWAMMGLCTSIWCDTTASIVLEFQVGILHILLVNLVTQLMLGNRFALVMSMGGGHMV